jgi:hypothetical protein
MQLSESKLAATTKAASPTRALHLWHLLSLDAPTVAALWTWFIARTIQLRLPLFAPLAMFVAVWTLYAADRLLDARQLFSNPLHFDNLEARHLFHHRHSTSFLSGIAIASIAMAALLPRITPEALHLYLILGGLLIGYFILIHATSGPTASEGSSHRLPKEFAVGLFFAAATFIPTVARRPDLRLPLFPPALLLASLCILNCLFIYAWEHEPIKAPTTYPAAHATTRLALRNLRILATTAALTGLALTVLDHSAPWPLSAACTLSIALLLTLDVRRHHIRATTLRVAADLALLTPLLFLKT